MVLNYIWIGFFVVAFIIALAKVIFLGDTEIFTAIMNATFDSSKTAFEISLGLTGVLALWLGIMKIGENSGLINSHTAKSRIKMFLLDVHTGFIFAHIIITTLSAHYFSSRCNARAYVLVTLKPKCIHTSH